jgi:hypothetical protein
MMPVEKFPELFCSGRKFLRLFCEIFKRHGLPQSIYSDRHSVFSVSELRLAKAKTLEQAQAARWLFARA